MLIYYNCQSFQINFYVLLKIFKFIDFCQNGVPPMEPSRNVGELTVLTVESNLFFILNFIAFQMVHLY